MPISPLLYSDIVAPLPLIAVLLHLLSSEPLPSARPPSLQLPSLWGAYPHHDASSAITAPFSRFILCRMYASLSLLPRRKRVLNLTIASDIRALMKPHIPEYYRFSLLLSSKAIRRYANTASIQ